MMTTPTPTTRNRISQPFDSLIDQSDCGKRAAIDVKMSSDIPLPMPRSVMSSPIHMMRPVPAVMVMTMSRMAYQDSLVMRLEQAGAEFEGNSAPLRATVMRVVDCRMPRAMVR